MAFFEYDDAIGDFAVTVLDLHGKKRVLSRGWRGSLHLAWSPKGDEVWFGAGGKDGASLGIHAVSLDNKERMVVQAPALMALDDVSRDGRVLATTEDTRMGISVLTPASKEERDLAWFDYSHVYDISADGKAHSVRRVVLRSRPERRHLFAQNGRFSGGSIGRWQYTGVVAGWKMGEQRRERGHSNPADSVADRRGRGAVTRRPKAFITAAPNGFPMASGSCSPAIRRIARPERSCKTFAAASRCRSRRKGPSRALFLQTRSTRPLPPEGS